jgi:hypothetical protein
MSDRIRKAVSFILLIAGSFFILPKELIHELSCHEDSIDHCIFRGENDTISTIHTHCDVLQLFISPFSLLTQYAGFAEAIHYFNFFIFNLNSPVASLNNVFEIRGPPTV